MDLFWTSKLDFCLMKVCWIFGDRCLFKIFPPVPSFSICAGTGTTLTHWRNAQSVHFIAPLAWLYTFFIFAHVITLIRIDYRHKSRAVHMPHIPLWLVTMHLKPIATDCLHVLEHILVLLTHTTCTIRTFSIVMNNCPFQRPVQLC